MVQMIYLSNDKMTSIRYLFLMYMICAYYIYIYIYMCVWGGGHVYLTRSIYVNLHTRHVYIYTRMPSWFYIYAVYNLYYPNTHLYTIFFHSRRNVHMIYLYRANICLILCQYAIQMFWIQAWKIINIYSFETQITSKVNISYVLRNIISFFVSLFDV